VKNQKIKFYPSENIHGQIFDPPVPTKTLIPKWYRDQDTHPEGKKFVIKETGNVAVTIKACMPVFDIITAGYTITLPGDVNFEKLENGEFDVSWTVNHLQLIESHARAQYDKHGTPEEYFPIAYKFINPWIIQTPPGYSCLFIQPSLQDTLPFQIVPAIVDTDKHPQAINFPFFIRKDFEGIIPTGTPIVQVIPFKRDNWEHESFTEFNPKFQPEWEKAMRRIRHRYKAYFRTIKKWD